MTKLSVIGILCLLMTTICFGQNSEYEMKGNDKEVTADFLTSYYDQTGNNGAVTGGIGTEDLQDYASMLVVNVPLDSINAINVTVGADFYTSASTDNINSRTSSASSKDLRAYGTIGYTRKNLKQGTTFGIKGNFSTEYDYTSVSGGFSFAKEFNEGNSELSLNAQAFFDNWETFFPQELRGEVSVPTTERQSYNFQATYSQVINQRMQFSISSEAILMKGLLSTPFHRVYFANQTLPDIERLPDSRLKIPIGLRLNIFPADAFILRTYYRFYFDDWGLRAHSMSLEVPIKINTGLTISPFYRFHTQNQADYFAPFAVHTTDEIFYTSDFDLSDLSSHKVGLGIKISPLYGVGRAKIPFTKKVFSFKSVDIRGAYYQRSTGLNAFIVSLGLSFGIK